MTKVDYDYLCKFDMFETRDLLVLNNALQTEGSFMGLIEYLAEKYSEFEYPDIHMILKDFAKLCTLRHKRGPVSISRLNR